MLVNHYTKWPLCQVRITITNLYAEQRIFVTEADPSPLILDANERNHCYQFSLDKERSTPLTIATRELIPPDTPKSGTLFFDEEYGFIGPCIGYTSYSGKNFQIVKGEHHPNAYTDGIGMFVPYIDEITEGPSDVGSPFSVSIQLTGGKVIFIRVRSLRFLDFEATVTLESEDVEVFVEQRPEWNYPYLG